MGRALRELTALMPSQDVVIEVLDARLPAASSNPLITEVRRDKPCIKVLTKSDLADPAVTRAWLAHFTAMPGVSAFAATTDRPADTRKLLLQRTAGLPDHAGLGTRAVIAGVPNVGKSTLVNVLSGRNVAEVSDRPAVTKEQQRVVLDRLVVTDSPGLSWQKFDDQAGALRLAFAGSIPDTAVDYIETALFGAGLLLADYPALVVARYRLDATPATPSLLLEAIARRRGKLRAGGLLDLDKAAEILVHEFRDGTIGRISLERP
jgi:ribosome biogenesis GTPase A